MDKEELRELVEDTFRNHQLERHSVSEPGSLRWWGHCRARGCDFESRTRDRSCLGWELVMRDDEIEHATQVLLDLLDEREKANS